MEKSDSKIADTKRHGPTKLPAPFQQLGNTPILQPKPPVVLCFGVGTKITEENGTTEGKHICRPNGR